MGKKSNDAPDYTPLANASAAANEKMTALGQQQLDFAKLQYEQNNPIMQEIAQKQGLAMDQQLAQGKDYYDYLKNTYRPVEQSIVADAQAFDTDELIRCNIPTGCANTHLKWEPLRERAT